MLDAERTLRGLIRAFSARDEEGMRSALAEGVTAPRLDVTISPSRVQRGVLAAVGQAFQSDRIGHVGSAWRTNRPPWASVVRKADPTNPVRLESLTYWSDSSTARNASCGIST
jgi:hypothetical protein